MPKKNHAVCAGSALLVLLGKGLESLAIYTVCTSYCTRLTILYRESIIIWTYSYFVEFFLGLAFGGRGHSELGTAEWTAISTRPSRNHQLLSKNEVHLVVHRQGPRTTVLRVALRLRPTMVFLSGSTTTPPYQRGRISIVLRKRSAGSARRFPAKVSSVVAGH